MAPTSCSAYPYRLIDYYNGTMEQNSTLMKSGTTLSQKLQALAKTKPDPTVLAPFEDLGVQLNSFGQRKESINEWVYQVGLAFLSADEKAHPAPPGSYDYQYSPSPTQLVTTTSDTIDQSMNGTLGSTGRDLADQLADAIKNRDYDKIADIVSRLKGFEDDPIITAEFFKELQSKDKGNIIYTARMLMDDHPDEFKLFATALGTATRSPDWDPQITKDLIGDDDPTGQWMPGVRFPVIAAMLKAGGVYSGDFLTQVGDWYKNNINLGTDMPVNVTAPDYLDDLNAVMQAFSRNPEAAYQYLTGKDTSGHDFYGGKLPRVAELLGIEKQLTQSGQLNQGDSHAADFAASLGNATLAADDSASPEDQKRLLEELGSIGWSGVPDGFRSTAAQLVERHIDLFWSDDQHPLEDWQRRLVLTAEMNGNGDADPTRVSDIQAAVGRWMLTQPFDTPGDQTNLAQRAGQLYELILAGPLGSEAWRKYEAAQSEKNLDLLTTIVVIVGLPFALEGLPLIGAVMEAGGPTADAIAGLTGEVLRREGLSLVSPVEYQGDAGDIANQDVALARATLLAIMQGHGDVKLPPGLSKADQTNVLADIAVSHDGAALEARLDKDIADGKLYMTTAQAHDYANGADANDAINELANLSDGFRTRESADLYDNTDDSKLESLAEGD